MKWLSRLQEPSKAVPGPSLAAPECHHSGEPFETDAFSELSSLFSSQIGWLSVPWQVNLTSACAVLVLLNGFSDNMDSDTVLSVPGRSSSVYLTSSTVAVFRHPHWFKAMIDCLRIAGFVQQSLCQDCLRAYPALLITYSSLSSCSMLCSPINT